MFGGAVGKCLLLSQEGQDAGWKGATQLCAADELRDGGQASNVFATVLLTAQPWRPLVYVGWEKASWLSLS